MERFSEKNIVLIIPVEGYDRKVKLFKLEGWWGQVFYFGVFSPLSSTHVKFPKTPK
jgi:hypothetical protein